MCDCRWMSDMFFFFFFKQKTAYEMRIRDWSSDVCSSDLRPTSMNTEPRNVYRKNFIAAYTRRGPPHPQEETPMRYAAPGTPGAKEIGRASCRERVCQYV